MALCIYCVSKTKICDRELSGSWSKPQTKDGQNERPNYLDRPLVVGCSKYLLGYYEK